jgi:hypothetical protein
VRGDPGRIIKRFLAAVALVGVAAMVALALGAAGSTHSLAGAGMASGSLIPDSMTWDTTSS